MSAESTLYGWLDAAAGLAALVGERIYPDVIPADQPLPAVAYARTNTEPVVTIHGTIPASFVPMRVECWAATRAAAEAVADAVVAAIVANGEVITNRDVLFDADSGNFGTAVELTLLV